MWPPMTQVRLWLFRQPTDMRKSYDGLSALVRHALAGDPLSGELFVFINRRRNQTTFSIPIELRRHHISMASTLRQASRVI